MYEYFYKDNEETVKLTISYDWSVRIKCKERKTAEQLYENIKNNTKVSKSFRYNVKKSNIVDDKCIESLLYKIQ